MKEINKIIEWNKICGNTNFNRHLESSMLSEEFAETIVALKENDKIEVLDGVIDMFWIWIWTLYKMWVTEEQIQKAFNEIEKSNYSKFIDWKAIKDETGKILKPKWYFKPNLETILKN